jgi:VIT1/CCC1 family predicted Fe2+/Mn2+ transporter
VHYWILTSAFLFLHLLLLGESEDVPQRPTLRRVVLAAALALAVSTVVTLVFQHLFLVRLP